MASANDTELGSQTTQFAEASAGGKIIVLGEHAVVYGHTALAGAIGNLVTCRASATSQPSSLSVPAWNIEVSASDEDVPASALRALLAAANVDSVALHVFSDVPPAAGLGSSAALCLAIARCLTPNATEAEHRDIAAAGEAQFHNQPSGIDVALSQCGGIARYDRANGLVPLEVPAFSLVVGLSGVSRSTAVQVGNVASRMRSDGGITAAAIAEMGACAEAGIEALLAGNMAALGQCMSACHRELQSAGVSLACLDSMVAIAMEAGALGAKLTGAGGGGAMIALAPGREDEVRAALQAQNYEAFVTTLGATK
tara:strand:- start:23576 stop:24511 length:936 start_codon:yes stop_codon:yes gene_type:complete